MAGGEPNLDSLRVRVPASTPAIALAAWLAQRFTYKNEHDWHDAITAGLVQHNGERADAATMVAPGDEVRFTPPPESAMAVTVLHEDEHCVVVDKPAGAVVQTASAFVGRTFLRSLAARLQVASLGPVHRLDRDTGGTLLLAKNAAALQQLQAQFVRGEVGKDYLALVHGRVLDENFAVTAAIGPAALSAVPSRRGVLAADSRGARAAHTQFSVLLRTRQFTLLHARPHTGRTHQIRVHLEHVGHALLGDKLYGRSDADYRADVARMQHEESLAQGAAPTFVWRVDGCEHHLLHAAALTFAPVAGSDTITVRAPLPQHFARRLAQCEPGEVPDRAPRDATGG